jgi:hypothetical protein
MFYDAVSHQVQYIPSTLIAGQYASGFVIADNGIGILGADGNLVVHDFVHQQRIMKVRAPVSGDAYRISADGKYFITGYGSSPELFRVDADTITRIWGTTNPPYGVNFCEFIPGDPEKLVVFGMNVLTIRNCSDFSVVKTFSLNIGSIANIDFNTGRILGLYMNSGTQTYEWRVYDLNTGALLKSCPRGGIVYSLDTRLNNNTLFWEDGYKFSLF